MPCIFAYLIIPYAGFRLQALRDMLESVARAEDIVKVYEARMTEKETTSLSPEEVEEYMSTLKVFLQDNGVFLLFDNSRQIICEYCPIFIISFVLWHTL